jgi:hypothetical protein
MLTIRDVQFKALSKSREPRLRARLEAHANQFFAEETATLTETAMDAILEQAIARPRQYGFKTDCDAAKWVNLMFTFGRDFDTDPRLAWAGELLAQAGKTEDRRPLLDRLFLAAMEHVEEARGIHGT